MSAVSESVWDYPRPPAVRACRAAIEVRLGGQAICRTSTSWQVLETSHPPPMGGDGVAELAGWYYPEPTPGFAVLLDHVALYAGPIDAVLVDGEQASPQPGGCYGGWITGGVTGPFKGVPGSHGW